jgi:NAD(P)-dependent dehydrogenase (short-subunit alcohol dehydrogenase family)
MTEISTAGVAVVTGAGRGLGRAVANRLAALGHHVVATDIDLAAAQETASVLPSATALALDVRDPAAHRQVAERAAELGQISVWVNNAGVIATGVPWSLDDDEISRIIDVNLLGVIHGCRAAIGAMAAGDGTGDVVNVSSLAGFSPVPGVGIYAATKSAVNSFTTTLAGDLQWAGLDRIRVHAFCPGAAKTGMVRAVADDPYSALMYAYSSMLSPESVADAVVRMIGSRSVLRSMPLGRAVFVRALGLSPRASLRLLPYFRRRGEVRRRAVLGLGPESN